jgi:hypothetical protein
MSKDFREKLLPRKLDVTENAALIRRIIAYYIKLVPNSINANHALIIFSLLPSSK